MWQKHGSTRQGEIHRHTTTRLWALIRNGVKVGVYNSFDELWQTNDIKTMTYIGG